MSGSRSDGERALTPQEAQAFSMRLIRERYEAFAKEQPDAIGRAGKPSKARRERYVTRLWAVQTRCFLCGGKLSRRFPTLEHVQPRALGGKTFLNVLLAHSTCNGEKADRAPYPCELIYLETVNRQVWPRFLSDGPLEGSRKVEDAASGTNQNPPLPDVE